MSKMRKVGIGIGVFIGIIIALGVIGSTISNDSLTNSASNTVPPSTNQESGNTPNIGAEDQSTEQISQDSSSSEDSSTRACIPGNVCFVSGDYLLYQTFEDGNLDWETRYSYAGTFDSNRIAVEKYDRTYDESFGMIVGGEVRNNVTSLEDFDPCCGLQSEVSVGGSIGYRYEVIQPSPVKIERWLEHETSADYWKDRVKADTYAWNGFDRSVIIVQEANIKQIIDKDTGIILLLENNQTQHLGWFQATKLVDTNIINSDSNYNPSNQLQELKVVVTPSKYSVSRGSEQTIFVHVSDNNDNDAGGASLSAIVTYASGSQKSFSGVSDSSGNWQFSWQIGGNSNAGTFRVEVAAFKDGFVTGVGTTSFSVTTAN